MVNPLYQATVTALEAFLSPRVVSRSLHEGLLQIGKTPETVSYPEIEVILKTQVYRQLQLTMPVVKAKETVLTLLAQLAEFAEPKSGGVPSAALEAQAKALDELKRALSPFNLYFEWLETQKLRAQLQLLESEHQAGRTAEALIQQCYDQLALLRQKLEDQLVIQARELGELQAALEMVSSLGGPKVRRLENLVEQIAREQARRQLAPAEVDRARKLAADLRKLMESSVVNEQAPPVPTVAEEEELLALEDDEGQVQIDVAALDPEVSARLLLIDVEREGYELAALANEYDNLLGFEPALQARVAELREQLARQQPLGEALSRLRDDLDQAREAWRARLSREFRDLSEQIVRAGDLPGWADAASAVQISLSILETTLPTVADIERARELAASVLRQQAERERKREQAGSALQLKLSQQAQAIAQLRGIAKRYQDEAVGIAERDRLEQALNTLAGVHNEGHLAPEQVAGARQLAAELESVVAQKAAAAIERQRAQVRSLLHQVEALPILPDLAAAGERLVAALKQQLSQLDAAPLPPADVAASGTWVNKFKEDLREAYRQALGSLMAQARDLDDAETLGYIQAALAHNESGLFPDLAAIHEALAVSAERRREEQLRELHQLEAEGRRYAHLAEFAPLVTLLQSARADLNAGKLAPQLKQGWHLLETLRRQTEEQVAGFLPRLEAALQAYTPLARLNSDDSHTAGRILGYLHEQREAFARVSPAMQHELLTLLRQAEELVEVLRDDYEATRAVADQLVSSNAIDDLLGLFVPSAPAQRREPTVVRGRYPPLDAWLDGFLAEPGVRCAAVVSPTELLAGKVLTDPDALRSTLSDLLATVAQLGERLQRGALTLITLELPMHSVVLALPTPGTWLFMVLDVPTGLSLILDKLRQELPTLAGYVRGP